MDIDLLWALGGWFLINLDCMATLKSSSISESSSKFHPFLLFLTLIFIFLVLVQSSDPSMATSSKLSAQSANLVPDSSSSASASNTMNLHHRKGRNPHKSSFSSTSREFEAGEHEVPSGPNPISN